MVKTERLQRHLERILHKSLVKQGLPKRSIRDQIQRIKNEAVENSSFISYAPYDNPEIVVAVVAPYFKDGSPSDYAAKVAKQVYDAYFAKNK